ncbi:hypothetical protein ACFLYS_03540 [Chloroflexota bacterium]
MKVDATQLYQEYMTDEAAADAKYKGKEIWITETVVDTYLESGNGCFLLMGWHPEELIIFKKKVVFFLPAFSVCTLKLEPQWSEGFRNVPPGYDLDLGMPITHEGYELGDFVDEMHIVTGYTVEVVGECLGISEGIITFKISRIAKTGADISEQNIQVY